MRELMRVYGRELGAYFASPIAYLFIGVFLAVTMFAFFWGEAFFARNIADVQPLFEWMPLLLIALVAVLTMRSWSEERRSGTLELLLTSPVGSLTLTAGKFLAALTLVAIALALTLSLPLTVEYLGPLDWGPVAGGYLASLFLAAAYVAIGLFVSSRTDNQIVSLLVTGIVGGVLYLIGSDWVSALAPQSLAAVLQLVGTGSRFDEITRGVLDLRDLYYYLSLVGVFLAFNVYSLEQLRWGGDRAGARRHLARRVALSLVAANFVVANLWLQPIAAARADLTATNRYSLSGATRTFLASLDEPLVIKAYFSRQSHPLLEPLTPQMRNLLREYDLAGGDNVRVSFVVPKDRPEAMRNARSQYGIKPVSLKTASRYKSSVVNAYFHVVIKYGSEHVVLGYRDLIQVDRGVGMEISVALRSPEYELTRSIRKVVHQYRSGGNLLASLDAPVTVHAYVSPADKLPKPLQKLRGELESMLSSMQSKAGDRLRVRFQPPGGADDRLAARLQRKYGFRPMSSSLFSDERFWFYLVLEQGGQTVPVQPPSTLKKEALRASVEAGLKRLGGGYLKTVAVYQPSSSASSRRRMMMGTDRADYGNLLDIVRENAAVTRTDLGNGRVPSDADMLMVLGPETLNARQRFAIDQFLMRGGAVMIAASPMDIQVNRRSGIRVTREDTGLAKWLRHYGVSIQPRFVLDPQSGTLLLPGGGGRLRSVDYPYFVDVREPGLADVPLMGGLHQLTMAWSSPITVEDGKVEQLEVTPLIRSSAESWTSNRNRVLPDYQQYPELGFKRPGQRSRHTLAVMLEGRFTSAFKGEGSPLTGDGHMSKAERRRKARRHALQAARAAAKPGGPKPDFAKEDASADKVPAITSVIEHSPDHARLVVFGSSSFASDAALGIVGRTTGTRYAAPAKLVQNVVDWSTGDRALLAIRGGSQYTRLLRPVEDSTRMLLESANYATALGGLLLIFLIQRGAAVRRRHHYQRLLDRGKT